MPTSGEFFSSVLRRRKLAGVELTILRQAEARELPSHGHERAYFSFLLAGSYRERIGRRELAQVAPSVVFHPPALEHIDAYGSGGGQVLVIEMERRRLEEWAGTRLPLGETREVQGEAVLPAAWALFRQVASPGVPPALAIDTHVVELFAAVLPVQGRSELGPPAWLHRIVERLRHEYAAVPSLSALAREAGVHPAHLSRTFRRFQGCSPSTFVHRLRTRHVWRRLLEADAPPLAEVALEAGFSDQSHCTRVFQRLVGSPPGRFRSQVRSIPGGEASEPRPRPSCERARPEPDGRAAGRRPPHPR